MRFYSAILIRLLILIICLLYDKVKYKKLSIFLIFLGCFTAGFLTNPLPWKYQNIDYLITFISLFIVIIYYFIKRRKKEEQQ